MRTITLTLAFVLISTAYASEVVLQPPTSPFPQAPFATAPDCHAQSIDATGASSGVCRYHGYQSVTAWAIATWDASGTPVSVMPCHLYSYQGSPVCPVQTFGPLQELSPGSYAFIQGTAAGVTVAITDRTPRESVLITP